MAIQHSGQDRHALLHPEATERRLVVVLIVNVGPVDICLVGDERFLVWAILAPEQLVSPHSVVEDPLVTFHKYKLAICIVFWALVHDERLQSCFVELPLEAWDEAHVARLELVEVLGR